MAEKKYQPPKNLENPFVKNLDEFQAMYEASIKDPKTFFGDQAEENLSWIEPFSSIHNGEFADGLKEEKSILPITVLIGI